MAAHNPTITERLLQIDDKVGSLTDFTPYLVGGLAELAGKQQPTQDLTGAADANPNKKRTGFTSYSNFKLIFEAVIGGTPDVVDQLWKNSHLPAGATRTVKGTFNTTDLTWSFAVECNIVSVRPIIEPGENAITTIEVEFEPTLASTETFA